MLAVVDCSKSMAKYSFSITSELWIARFVLESLCGYIAYNIVEVLNLKLKVDRGHSTLNTLNRIWNYQINQRPKRPLKAETHTNISE